MKITYIPEHTWQKPVTDDPLSIMGKSNRTRLRSTLTHIPDLDISHTIEPLTSEILDWFTPLYTETISDKKNPKLFDIYGTTLGKQASYPYFALIVRENGTPIGATIFSERSSLLSIAYRIYPNEWMEARVQANPSLYSELLINQYAHERGFTKLSHGRDRNPYGLNSNIGLAIFKLSIGCTPFISKEPPPAELFDTDTASVDALIFEQPESGRQITQGYLLCTEETCDRYSQATKYKEQITVETILRT